MALSWTESKVKFQRISRDTESSTLIQAEQDMNTGYHMFNAKLGRYFSRKQQFTDVIAGQAIYQTPIDSIRIIGMTVKTAVGTNSYSPPIKEIRDEEEWRLIKTVPSYASNWISHYFVLGDDEIEVWQTPSDNIPNGIRFYYQQADHDLSVDDILSTTLSQTCTVTNGQTLVTSTGSTFTNELLGLFFQVRNVTNLTLYQIIDVPTSSTLTLKSPFVGNSGSGFDFRIGQFSILPQQYQDAPIHYALGLFFMGKGNSARAQYHLGSDEDGKRGMFWSMVQDAVKEYSSSTEGNVISDADNYISPWQVTPLPGVIL